MKLQAKKKYQQVPAAGPLISWNHRSTFWQCWMTISNTSGLHRWMVCGRIDSNSFSNFYYSLIYRTEIYTRRHNFEFHSTFWCAAELPLDILERVARFQGHYTSCKFIKSIWLINWIFFLFTVSYKLPVFIQLSFSTFSWRIKIFDATYVWPSDLYFFYRTKGSN